MEPGSAKSTFWPQFVTHVSPYDKLGFRDTLLTKL